ncbi:MAG: histidine kinase [Saprospiraceae bacterium]|nr:histidine kinase [Saprospiraceae bacterium]
MKSAFTVLIWLTYATCCYCQPSQLYFNHLTQNDGLSQTTNNVIFQDSKGFVWISSLNGLNRYDGQNIKRYKSNPKDPHSLPGDYIQSRIIEDDSTNLWFTTYEALVCYVRKHDHFEIFQDTADNGHPIYGYLLGFQLNRKKLAIIEGTSDLMVFDLETKQFEKKAVLPSNIKRVIPTRDSEDSISSIIAFNYDEPGLHFIEIESNVRKKYAIRFDGATNEEPSIHASDAIRAGDTIFVAGKEGFLRFHLKNDWWDFYPTADWYPSRLAFFGDGKIIASLIGGGWLFINRKNFPTGTRFDHDPDNPWSLSSSSLYGVWEDPTGVIWTGVSGKGVDFTQPRKVKFKTLDIGKLWNILEFPVGVQSIVEDQEKFLWLASSSGIYVLSPEKKPVRHFSNSSQENKILPRNNVHNLLIDKKNRCWAFTWNGLGMFDIEQDEKSFHQIDTTKIYIFGLELNEGQLIFSNANGGMDILNESGEVLALNNLESFPIKAKYTYLFQNHHKLLYACRDLTSIEVRDPANDFKVKRELLFKADIHYFYEDVIQNVLWIASSNGLICVDQDTWQMEIFTEEDGLPDKQIYAVSQDGTGMIWLSTNLGIVRFSPSENKFHVFDIPDGLQALEFNARSFLKHSNGEFWFGGINGVNYFHPEKVSFIGTPPKIQFTNLWVNENEVPHPECVLTKATNISEVKKLTYSYRENTLGFEFAALEFSNPQKNAFQYMMKGYDKDWVDAGTKGYARYPNLPPGSYTFMVKGANSDGVWSDPHGIEIEITPPIWQRLWFQILIGLIIIATAYLIYRSRLARLRKQYVLQQKTIESEMKALRAQMNPHFIFNCINSINAFILKNKSALASEYLNNFANLIRQILDISSEETIPLEEETNFLESYLKAEKLRLKEKLQWNISVDENIDTFETVIPSMIIQPFVENAIWHGISPKETTGLIDIRISKEKEALVCIVQDDGIGKEASKERRQKLVTEHQSKGESNPKERLALYDQRNKTQSSVDSIDIYSPDGQATGTRIILKIGLRK